MEDPMRRFRPERWALLTAAALPGLIAASVWMRSS
jgi:hypothetical protein